MIGMSYNSGSKLWMKRRQKTCKVVTVIQMIGIKAFVPIMNHLHAVSSTPIRSLMVECLLPIRLYKVTRAC